MKAFQDKRIRVLIVDDSVMVRTMLSRLLSTDPGIEVVGFAADPYVARDKLLELKPDVMTLDVEMPKMDGVTFLEKVMEYFPVRTIIISSLTSSSATIAFRALELGAIDVMAKPALDVSRSLEEVAMPLVQKIKAVARAQLPRRRVASLRTPASSSSGHLNVAKASWKRTVDRKRLDTVVAIASSTGGTEAIKETLLQLPEEIPPILIVQHMPPIYSRHFAASLQKICPFEVREAEDGDEILPNRVLLAPGDFHMEAVKEGGTFRVRLNQGPAHHGVRPAADPLMSSVARIFGAKAVGVVLTGMGKDGTLGLLEMKAAGSHNIAQDEETCVVFGMPCEAIKRGAVHVTLPLEEIGAAILAHFRGKLAA